MLVSAVPFWSPSLDVGARHWNKLEEEFIWEKLVTPEEQRADRNRRSKAICASMDADGPYSNARADQGAGMGSKNN